jgi:hypothetical protein
MQRLVLLCALLWTAVSNGFGQASTPAKSPEAQLTPVAWLVGGTWVTDIKSPQSGAMIHVDNHITWAPNHAAIQFVTDFNGKPHYNGFYAYDAAAQAVKFYYTSESGDLSIGTAALDQDGKTLRQDFDITHPNGKVEHFRSTIVREGENAYQFTVLGNHDGEWKPEFQLEYQRKP